MNQFTPIGKLLIILGAILVALGVFIVYGPKIPFVGKLPGDIYIKRENFTFYFPITTSILISLVLTLIFFLIQKFK